MKFLKKQTNDRDEVFGVIDFEQGETRCFSTKKSTRKEVTSEEVIQLFRVFLDGKSLPYGDHDVYNENEKVLGNARDIYHYILDMTPAQKFLEENWMSEKSKNYLDIAMHRINLITILGESDQTDIVLENEREIYSASYGGVWLGKVDNQWAVQASGQTNVDSFYYKTFFFSKRPSIFEIDEAIAIDKMAGILKYNTQKEYIKCYECGREVHWTDLNVTSIEGKMKLFIERMCGYCDDLS